MFKENLSDVSKWSKYVGWLLLVCRLDDQLKAQEQMSKTFLKIWEIKWLFYIYFIIF